MKWHHCRACGEEGLTPEDERCPHCGVRAPVTVCDGCGLPIREGTPWTLVLVSADEPDRPEERAFHEACYPAGRRRVMRSHRPPNWQVSQDARDPHEPLSPQRLMLGTGVLVVGLSTVVFLIASAPRPKPVFSAENFKYLTGKGHDGRTWVHLVQGPRQVLNTFTVVLITLGLTTAALWAIRWGLSRRRALFWKDRYGDEQGDKPHH